MIEGADRDRLGMVWLNVSGRTSVAIKRRRRTNAAELMGIQNNQFWQSAIY
jgi:hypothetical protein